MDEGQARSTWRLIGTLLGMAIGLALALAMAGSIGTLIAVLYVALPFALPITLMNAFLFAHFGSNRSQVAAVIGGVIGGVVGVIESAFIWRVIPNLIVIVVVVGGGIAYLVVLAQTFARRLWDRASAPVNRILGIEVGLSRKDNLTGLYYGEYPKRLELNVPALILGPFWYLLAGLWVHFAILAGLAFTTGGVLAPFVWLYSGLKANEDLLEFRVARRSFY